MSRSSGRTAVTLGFVPLTDCAPLVVAKERGLFAAEGLDVRLSREASWANIRDKVVSGALDGAHMLAPMALACSLGADGPATPLIAPMALNANGSSLGVSTSLAAQIAALDGVTPPPGVRTAGTLKRLIDLRRVNGERPLTFAVVFPFSIHNYMLRYWLADAGIDPDQDVRLTVTPPPRIAARAAAGEIDGFCVGAPWGWTIEAAGAGQLLLHGAEFWAGAPDKVLGVTAAWAAANPDTLQAVMRALMRAAAWADDPANEAELGAMLSARAYVDAAPAMLARALSKANPNGLRFHVDGVGYPRAAHALWLLSQMRRWGQIREAPGQEAAAAAVYRPDLYLQAAAAVGAPMRGADVDAEPLPPLFDGRVFDPARLADYVAGFAVRQPVAPAQ
jgi:ABC-type nitrate/sulfonate/bicarbonate transport system substrate-binding protein